MKILIKEAWDKLLSRPELDTNSYTIIKIEASRFSENEEMKIVWNVYASPKLPDGKSSSPFWSVGGKTFEVALRDWVLNAREKIGDLSSKFVEEDKFVKQEDDLDF